MSITPNPLSCGHCNNISQMEIIGHVCDNHSQTDPDHGIMYDWSTNYDVAKCPACKKVTIISYDWNDSMDSDDETDQVILYPVKSDYPMGLPDNILKAYMAAEKVKSIDVNAYAILMRRLLELVCLDRNTTQKTLASMLNDLSNKGEIPNKLVKVAEGLKNFGNIGAHAGSGDLSEREIPIVSALASAILEYVYSAPSLATAAENMLNKIKEKKKK